MEFEVKRAEALKYIKLADYILTMTYPLLKDPKLLKLVMKNIRLALKSSVDLVIDYERKYKRINYPGESFRLRINALRPVLQRYGLSLNYIAFLNEIEEVMYKQKMSDVEFIRKDKFVFASKDYDLSYITQKDIVDYMAKAKLFIQQILSTIENAGTN